MVRNQKLEKDHTHSNFKFILHFPEDCTFTASVGRDWLLPGSLAASFTDAVAMAVHQVNPVLSAQSGSDLRSAGGDWHRHPAASHGGF